MFCAKVVLYCNNRKFIAMALSSNPALIKFCRKTKTRKCIW